MMNFTLNLPPLAANGRNDGKARLSYKHLLLVGRPGGGREPSSHFHCNAL